MSDLKACPSPFCIFDKNPWRLQVSSYMEPSDVSHEAMYHVRCGCGMKGPQALTAEGAVKAWNTRLSEAPTAPAKVEGAGMTPDLIEHARKWAFNYDYLLKDAICDLALRGLDAGTRGE